MGRGTRTAWIGLCSQCRERILRPELEEEKLKSVSMMCDCGTFVDCFKITFTGQALTPQARDFHHIWCNGQRGSVLGCRWCLRQNKNGDWEGLWIDYPYDPATMTGHQLMKTHFPQNISRT